MEQFFDPSTVSDEHYYIYLYPTQMPRVTTSPLRQVQGKLEDWWESQLRDTAVQRRVFRLPFSHLNLHEHLYSEEEMGALRGGYLHYVSMPMTGKQVLALGEPEFNGLRSGLREFFREESPTVMWKSPARRAEPFHPFLSYFNRTLGPLTSVVLNRTAMERTVDDLTSDPVKNREAELLEFLKEHKPGVGLDEVYLTFKDAIVMASLLDGSIGLIKEMPGS